MERMKKKSPVLGAALPVIAALLVSGCGGGGGGSSTSAAAAIANVTDAQLKGTQITVSRFFGDCTDQVGTSTDASKAVGECASITTLTNKFNAENKWGIKVTRLGGAAWNTYYVTLNAAIAGGTPPDIAIMHGSSITDYAKRGLLLPIDSDLTKITGVNLGDAIPEARQAIAYNGQDYAVPFDLNGALFHVNVDIWKQAGLVDSSGNPVLPHSTDEFLADAAKVKQATGKNFMALPRVGDALGVHMFESLLEQQGSDIVNSSGTQANLDTPEARKVLSFMDKMFSGGFVNGNQTYDAANQSFLKGEVASEFNGTWLVDQFNTTAKFKYKVFSMPTLFAKPAVWADNHIWTIPKQPKPDPVKYRAALEFVSYLFAHDRDWALATGHITVRQSVIDSSEYKAAPQRASYADTAQTVANSVPHIANWPAVFTACIKAIESIWFQHVSADQALKAGSDAINAALNQ